ncbi:MAG: hypothetical protein GY926_26810 [bacterium]|nr:hypothetical protein [bacterium]
MEAAEEKPDLSALLLDWESSSKERGEDLPDGGLGPGFGDGVETSGEAPFAERLSSSDDRDEVSMVLHLSPGSLSDSGRRTSRH